MKFIQDIENQENLKSLIILDLKELGIKIPKHKKSKTRDDSLELGRKVFGSHLCLMPSIYVENIGPVPKFLVEASAMLEQHAETEGLFRRSGSLARQKELRQRIEMGEALCDCNPLDVSSLLKQFFRELPDPLLTNRLHDTFIRAYGLEPETRRLCGLLLLCHLLPWHNLCVLRFMMTFLQRISSHSEHNKMDILNLAVCLAPNLLYTTCKTEKLSQSDSQLLQIQTNIVQLLITHADAIGLVSESLVERTTLMGACFPSEDELDRSDTAQNDSKTGKKKKKRSASFQGLMSNLSSSFSKWRKDTKHHNQSGVSERSAYSFTSVVDKSSLLIPDQPDSLAYLEMLGGYPDTTPKMIRKRKAEDEAVPFSASKKQAILQSMPQMSALGGTPFTPATVKRGARPQDFFDTPSIKFSQGENAIFAATPRMKMDRHLSTPSTGSKDKRKSPGKSGCFSPKTPRNGVRRTMRGFLKRLSGGKESQLMERSASSGECPSALIDPNSVRKKSLFRKHRKTPSSPARLITPSGGKGSPTDSHMPLLQLDASPGGQEVPPTRPSTHERRYSADGTPVGGANLKRGRPNTLRTGLPSPSHRRSLDRQQQCNNDREEEDEKYCFVALDKYGSPQAPSAVEYVASTVDTSPILKEAGEVGGCMSGLEETELEASHMMRQTSATSMVSLNVQESDHDRAFIHESMLSLDEENDESSSGEDESPVFKMPEIKSPCNDSALRNRIIQKQGAEGLSTRQEGTAQGASPGKPHTHSVESLDSAIDCEGTAGLKKCPSLQSVESFDSGLSVSDPSNPKVSSSLSLCQAKQSVSSVESVSSVCHRKKGAVVEGLSNAIHRTKSTEVEAISDGSKNSSEIQDSNRSDNGKTLTEEEDMSPGNTSVVLQRRPSIRSHSGENKLRISKNTHQLLARAGKMAPENEVVTEDRLESLSGETIAEKCEDGDSETSMEVDSQSVEDAVEEICARKASPLRFPNSVSRRRGSPVRVPTVFAKGDREASRYKELAKNALRMSPRPKKPFLPLSTNLVNAASVLQAKSQMDTNAGHTPCRLLTDTSLQVQDSTPRSAKSHTPIIKGGLFSHRHLDQFRDRGAVGTQPTGVRSPVKPIKRLQAGATKSPKKLVTPRPLTEWSM